MLKKIRNFLENTSGSILPTMGILIIPLGMAVGVAVDYTRYVNVRTDVQAGIDAAGIASIAELPNIKGNVPSNLTGSAFNAKVETDLKTYAQGFLEANITSNIAKDSYTFNITYIPATANTDGGVEIIANIEYDTIFGGINGQDGGPLLFNDKLSEKLTSLITTGNRTIEVALVMDNSGSMNGTPSGGSSTKISSMKTAALKLVDDLYKSAADSPLPDSVQFSLVPFAGMVNVGPLGHTNLDGNFIDVNGFNPAHNENLDWDGTFRTSSTITKPFSNHVVKVGSDFKNRFDVYNMLGETWEGCVEMRPWPHNVLDTFVSNQSTSYSAINNSMDADGNGTNDGAKALFVPAFAPDEPDSKYAKNKRIRWGRTSVRHYNDDDVYWNSYLYDFEDSDGKQLYTDESSSDPAYQIKGSTKQIQRTNWMFKYQNNNKTKNYGSWSGPNYGCTTDPITALTPTQSTVDSAINAMGANGTTNIQQGLTWGWRTLSEGLPFDQGRPKSDVINLKFIILLTDGNNFYDTDGDSTPNESEYGAWGYARPDSHSLKHAISNEATHNRMSEGLSSTDLTDTIYTMTSFDLTPNSHGDFNEIMNAHTAQSCENVKQDGVSIYTIVYDLNDTATEDLMEACAGPGIIDGSTTIAGVEFYHEADGATLDDTFAKIASSISAIRIAK